MPIDSGNLALKGLDELFSTEEKRQEEQREQVQQIPIDELHPFTNHPFKVVDDEAMTRTVESIAQFGVLAPLIARPRPDGDGYEIISGHRRQFAAKMAGLETLPVIVRDMDDDAATILMVDSNLQREHISPSERAFAYKMKMDAMKRTAGRPPKENPRQVVGNFETADLIGKESGESGRQVQRFIRLTNLIPELLDMVDEKKVSFNPAVELSYLSHEQQQEVINAMDDTQNAPSFSQAKRIKKLAQEGNFTSEAVVDIMGEEKKSEQDTVTIKNETLRKYSLILEKGFKPNSMEIVHTLLHPTFTMAVRDGLLRLNPTEGVMAEIKKSHCWEKTKRHALTVPEQRAFTNYIANSEEYRVWYPLFTVMLGTGCRIGEVLGLRWQDVDFKNRTISINHNLVYRVQEDGTCTNHVNSPKTKAGIRIIPMLDEVFDAFLEEYQYQKVIGFCTDEIDGYSGFVFCTGDGKVYLPTSVGGSI